MIQIYHKTNKQKKLQAIQTLQKNSWVYAEKPTEEDLLYLQKKCKLDEDLLNDALDPYEVPRLETEKGVL